MEIEFARKWRGKQSTLSTLAIGGHQVGYILEDADRGLRQDMALEDIQKLKFKGRTAIPEGRYQVAITYSTRFKRLLPILLTVPGFSGIRLHPGNRHTDTEGCPLPGTKYLHKDDDYQVLNSRILFDDLFAKIQGTIKSQKEVWVTIKSNY